MIPDSVLQWRDLSGMGVTFSLEPELVLAVIWQESGGIQAAWNPEQRYRWFWNVRTNAPFRRVTDAENMSEYPPTDFPSLAGDPDQEWWGQQASWGLMQPMGAVARECGMKNKYVGDLLIFPELNIQIGCTHLSRKLKQAGGDVRGALLRYNGGGNQKYDDEVTEKYELVKGA
jgi:hypothetical protein